MIKQIFQQELKLSAGQFEFSSIVRENSPVYTENGMLKSAEEILI